MYADAEGEGDGGFQDGFCVVVIVVGGGVVRYCGLASEWDVEWSELSFSGGGGAKPLRSYPP